MAWCKRHCISMLAGFATTKPAAPTVTSTLSSNWKKKISVFTGFTRRNSSSVATKEIEKKAIMDEESHKYKSLYLCFQEFNDALKNVHVIQSIRLNHLLSPPVHGGNDLKLQKVAYRSGPRAVVPRYMSTSVVGSKIIFSGGMLLPEKICYSLYKYSLSKEVCVFETDPSINPNPKLLPSNLFEIKRAEPILVEVDNKLYRFGGCCDCESFEVFEPIQNDWLPLAVPPRKYPYGFTHAIAGTKILLWGRNQTGVYMFDASHPDKGWTELDPCVGDYIPSIDGYDQLFIKMKSRYGDGEGFLMFSFNLERPHTVLASYISHTFDSLKPMEPLQLPAERPPKFDSPCGSEFFHLGGQQVGIVLSCDNDYVTLSSHYDLNSDGQSDGEDKPRVLVIIFEYEIEKSMDIKYKLLSSRFLEYSTKHDEEESRTNCSDLRAAYVL